MSPTTHAPSRSRVTTRPWIAPKWRIIVVAVLMTAALLLLLAKAGRLQLVLGGELRELAERQYLRDLRVEAPRGSVLDRDGRPLAVTVPSSSIYAVPRDITQPKATAATLAPIIGMPADKLERRLTGKRAFVWLTRRVSPAVADQVRGLALVGIGQRSEPRRYYPGKSVAGQLLGTVSIDGEGQSGVERAFDKYLRGRTSVVKGLRDNHGRRVLLEGGLDVDIMHGDDVVLTIDGELQHLAERLLVDAVARYDAKAAFAVLMDPKTGAILALANAPLFNPNTPRLGDGRRNHAISDAFEPGSTMKIVTFAAALDKGVVDGKDRVFCENGKLRIGRHTIRDAHPAGWLTAAEVFSHSSNIGTIKIAQRVGEEGMREALTNFGFGQRPGLGLVGESGGRLPERWGEVRLATVAFGHGLLVTPVQMAAAVSAVANGGVYVPPHLLARVTAATGESVARGGDGETRRVISAAAAEQLVEIMMGVAREGGTGRRAAIRGIDVAGKTGTAEKVDPVTGRYSRELHLSSFVGFAPAKDPKVVAVVMIDEPKGVVFGGSTAGPIWRQLVEAALIDDGILDASAAGDSAAAPREAAPEAPRADTSIIEFAERAAPAPGFAPELRGLDARAALQAAGAAGARLRITGTGLVRAQTPAAGARLEDDQIIELMLKVNDGPHPR